MSGGSIEVTTYDVTTAAGKFKSAASDVRAADPSGDLSPVSSALSGSESASAASTLATEWKQQWKDWARAADGQYDKLVRAADNYDRYERSVTEGMSNTHRGGPQPAP